MAQPILDEISAKVSNIIGDSVTACNTDGILFTAADRCGAINMAIKAKYDMAWLEIKDAKLFGKAYPEFRKQSGALALAANAFAKPSDYKAILDMELVLSSPTFTGVCGEIPPNCLYEAITNSDSAHAPVAGVLFKYFEFEATFTIYTGTLTGNAYIIYIFRPVDLVIGSTDYVYPIEWKREIILMAAELLLNEQQSI